MVSMLPDHGLEPYYRRELMSRFALCCPSTRKRGRAWYPTARALMLALAAETDYTLEQAVAVMAITSPGAQLVSNLAWTRTALESRGAVDVGRFPNAMRPKIAAVLADAEYAAEYVTGPKVGPFFRAILGDTGALVLDRWAFFAAAGGDRDSLHDMNRGAIDAIAAAYRSAAKSARMRLRDFQATIWIQARESTPKIAKNGTATFVRLADITSA
jgi:hypothetical protein